MIHAPNFLIIGAAGRNVGKTEFACELIKAHSGRVPVIGIKVTTIKERDGKCPRGGKGCGVCSSLTEDFHLTEESISSDDKDTTRMLKAGAQKVYWLRVLAEHLDKGVTELLRQLPDGAAVVCESNSMRSVLNPGLFLVVKEQGVERIKPTCHEQVHLADKRIEYSGDRWDFLPEQITYLNGVWQIKPEATGIVLSGGKSRRMGQDKSLLPYAGKPMIQHVTESLGAILPEIIIGGNSPGRYGFLGLPVVPDAIEGRGPMMGLISCLEAASHELAFLTGCDIPVIDQRFVLSLIAQAPGYDIVMPRTSEGYLEPLMAVYRKTVIPAARDLIGAGTNKLIEITNHVRVRYVDMPDNSWYRNINTMDDYDRLLKSDGAN